MMELLASAALKGSLLLVAAWIATAMLRRRSADVRHRIWLGALAGIALLLLPLRMPQAAQVEVPYTLAITAAASAPVATAFRWDWVWAVGFAFVLARFASTLTGLWLLTRRARPTDVRDVRVCDQIASPLTWGALRPVILLPAGDAHPCALVHEREHIARRDWLWQSFAQLLCAVFWFHPLVWLAASRLRSEAEHAVDDAVLRGGAEAARYAEQLLDVARRVKVASPTGAVAMVRRPQIAERISAVLDASRVRTPAGLGMRVAVGLLVLCAVPVLRAMQGQVPISMPAFVPKSPIVWLPTPAPAPKAKPAEPRLIAQAAPAPQPAPAPQQGPYPIGNGVSAPAVIYQVQPQMPQSAKDAGVEGEVWLTTVVDENGIPTQIAVTRSLGYGLDEAAIEAIHQWRFKPGMKDGSPVSVRATIAVKFKLL